MSKRNGHGLTVEIPMAIPPTVSPNYHGTVRGRMVGVKTWRNAVYYMAVDARNRLLMGDSALCARLPFSRVELVVECVVGRRGLERDKDNTIAGLKPAVDGLVAAGILATDAGDAVSYKIQLPYTVDRARAPLTIIKVLNRGWV